MQKNHARKLIVGLGNPGEEYAGTYHNVGVIMLNRLLSVQVGLASLPLKKAQALDETDLHGQTHTWSKHKNLFEYIEKDGAVFVRPLTYMNESGKAVREAMKKFGIKPENLIIIHDDSDITIGSYKNSFARSSAGHKGVQSVIDALKTNAFERIRIGIRPAREKERQKAGEFALKKISKGDKLALDEVFNKILQNRRDS